MSSAPPPDAPLWPDRYLTDGRIVIRRSRQATASTPWPGAAQWWEPFRQWFLRLDWLAWCGRAWLRLSRGQQWGIGVLLFLLTGGVALVVPLAGVLLHRHRIHHPPGRRPQAAPVPPPMAPDDVLASWDTTEARVAAAASRAWAETVREPAWHSPFLTQSRATFDGSLEVDQIIDLAHRFRHARLSLGPRPAGAAAEYWDRQFAALENAARQLGSRADALIRYRDQTAELSTELQRLAELERLERSATEIDGLTIETAFAYGPGHDGLSGVAVEIAGVRTAMTELVDLMTRTRAPLAEPPDHPPSC